MSRLIGIIAGILNHLLFAYTVWRLVGFLGGAAPTTSASQWMNVPLALQFSLVHSTLLVPAVRERLSRVVPGAFYGTMFCATTCAGLLLTIECWRRSPLVLWECHGAVRWGVQAAFVGSWALLFYSLSLTGLGYQTGWTPWWHWVRRRSAPPRPFQTRGLYRRLRHPIYLSFLGLIWFTPVVTFDRAVLIALWTVHIFIGSWLKDRRLRHYIGEPYREYQSRVPGYPGMPCGPLARIPYSSSASERRRAA